MTNAEPRLPVLALNSGSSSLKFALYRVGPSRTEMLLSGEAESIGDKKGKFHAQDSHENALLSETVAIPSQQGRCATVTWPWLGQLGNQQKLKAPTQFFVVQ